MLVLIGVVVSDLRIYWPPWLFSKRETCVLGPLLQLERGETQLKPTAHKTTGPYDTGNRNNLYPV